MDSQTLLEVVIMEVIFGLTLPWGWPWQEPTPTILES